jgi:hypothetical protein
VFFHEYISRHKPDRPLTPSLSSDGGEGVTAC